MVRSQPVSGSEYKQNVPYASQLTKTGIRHISYYIEKKCQANGVPNDLITVVAGGRPTASPLSSTCISRAT